MTYDSQISKSSNSQGVGRRGRRNRNQSKQAAQSMDAVDHMQVKHMVGSQSFIVLPEKDPLQIGELHTISDMPVHLESSFVVPESEDPMMLTTQEINKSDL